MAPEFNLYLDCLSDSSRISDFNFNFTPLVSHLTHHNTILLYNMNDCLYTENKLHMIKVDVKNFPHTQRKNTKKFLG